MFDIDSFESLLLIIINHEISPPLHMFDHIK